MLSKASMSSVHVYNASSTQERGMHSIFNVHLARKSHAWHVSKWMERYNSFNLVQRKILLWLRLRSVQNVFLRTHEFTIKKFGLPTFIPIKSYFEFSTKANLESKIISEWMSRSSANPQPARIRALISEISFIKPWIFWGKKNIILVIFSIGKSF